MARPRNVVPTVEWKVYIPADIAAQVELLLLDPMRERVRHGARGELIAKLLREWLEKRKAEIAEGRRVA